MEEQEKQNETPVETPQPEPKPKKKKTSTIIIIILLLIIVGAGVFIFLNRDSLFNDNNKQEEKAKPVETQKAEEQVEEPTPEKVKLDISKCANCPEGWEFSGEATVATAGFGDMVIKVENNNPTVTIDWDEYCKTDKGIKCPTGKKTYNVTGITKNIKSGVIGYYGQSDVDTSFLFLLEDGSIEYTKLYQEYTTTNTTGEEYTDWKVNITNDSFPSNGAIKGIKDIVKIYSVNVAGGMSGFITMIGETEDGTLYNLDID